MAANYGKDASRAKARRELLKAKSRCVVCGKQDARTLKGFTMCESCAEIQRAKNRAVTREKKREYTKRYKSKKARMPGVKKWFADHNIPYTPPDEIEKCLACTKPECDNCIERDFRRETDRERYRMKKEKEAAG